LIRIHENIHACSFLLAAMITIGAAGTAGAGEDTAMEEDTEAEVVGGPLAPDNFSLSIWLTTDYMDLGISNNDEDPAVQASIDWSHNGYYLGVWSSPTAYSDGNMEINFYGGYAWEWNGLSLDAGLLYYYYPGEDENRTDGLDPGDGAEADYWEASFAVSRAFETWLSPVATATYFYSPDFFGEDGDAHALDGNLTLSLPCEFTLILNTGYQDVAGGMLSPGGYDYLWWKIGLNRDVKGFNVEFSYHEVDDKEEACGGELCDARVVFTISRVF
jgi:uncharacterized protein (TIGR02001 family)